MQILKTAIETYPAVTGKTVSLIAVFTCGVLGVGDLNDSAVYVGTVELGDYDSNPANYMMARAEAINWIAHNGEKQTLVKARRYFPTLTEGEYRS